MKNTKMRFRTLLTLVLTVVFIYACEQEKDEFIPAEITEVSEEPIPQFDPHYARAGKVTYTTYGRWDSATAEQFYLAGIGDQVSEVINEIPTVNPDYQKLLNAVSKAEKDYEDCQRRGCSNDGEEDCPCPDEDDAIYEAEQARDAYERSGLPLTLAKELYVHGVAWTGTNFDYFEDINTGTRMALPTHNPDGISPIWELITMGKWNLTERLVTYKKCGNDKEAPIVSCSITTKTITADEIIPDLTGFVTATDNCELVSVTQSPSKGTVLKNASQAVTLTAKDANGYVASCTITVYKKCGADKEAPVINCSIATKTLTAGENMPDLGSYVSATDNCEFSRITQNPSAGTNIKEGTQTVYLYAYDTNNNKSSCTIKVIGSCVDKGILPVMSGSTSIRRVDAGTKLKNYRSSYSGVDQCGNNLTISQSPSSGVTVQVGYITVTMKATDKFGNSNTRSFSVEGEYVDPCSKEEDTTRPIMNCVAPSVDGYYVQGIKTPDFRGYFSATDNCNVTLIQYPTQGSTLSANLNFSGQTATKPISIYARDEAGNLAVCTFNILLYKP